MRGADKFSCVDFEARVWRDHPLRANRVVVIEPLVSLEREFAALVDQYLAPGTVVEACRASLRIARHGI